MVSGNGKKKNGLDMAKDFFNSGKDPSPEPEKVEEPEEEVREDPKETNRGKNMNGAEETGRVLARHRTVKEIFEDINKKKNIGEKKASKSELPTLILAPLIILVIVTGIASILEFKYGNGNDALYGFTALVYAIFIIILVVK